MKHSFTKKHLGLAVSCALALGIVGVVSGAARAESSPFARAYVTDQREAVATSGFGECWHTGSALPLLESKAPCEARMARVPEPERVAMVSEPMPKTVDVTFNADTLFDFDKAELRPAGRAALDAFLGKIADLSPETITAAGHTDRLGPDSYNQRLSEQRAQAVKSYLVSKGVQPDRIQAEGRGEAQPVTRAGECAGAKNAEVIACLQPDRRVEVQVVGRAEVR
jgi:OOP family OmpA-OmpF porin